MLIIHIIIRALDENFSRSLVAIARFSNTVSSRHPTYRVHSLPSPLYCLTNTQNPLLPFSYLFLKLFHPGPGSPFVSFHEFYDTMIPFPSCSYPLKLFWDVPCLFLEHTIRSKRPPVITPWLMTAKAPVLGVVAVVGLFMILALVPAFERRRQGANSMVLSVQPIHGAVSLIMVSPNHRAN